MAQAYGWPADISEQDALAKLFELNLSRPAVADATDKAQPKSRGTGVRKAARPRSAQRELLLPIPGGKPTAEQGVSVEHETEEEGVHIDSDTTDERQHG